MDKLIKDNTTDKDIIELCRHIYAWLVYNKEVERDVSLLALANGEIREIK